MYYIKENDVCPSAIPGITYQLSIILFFLPVPVSVLIGTDGVLRFMEVRVQGWRA